MATIWLHQCSNTLLLSRSATDAPTWGNVVGHVDKLPVAFAAELKRRLPMRVAVPRHLDHDPLYMGTPSWVANVVFPRLARRWGAQR